MKKILYNVRIKILLINIHNKINYIIIIFNKFNYILNMYILYNLAYILNTFLLHIN